MEHRAYLNGVREYYDGTNDLILRYVGNTYQVGLIAGEGADPYQSHNLYCAAQAGIQPGHRVLDAGCGNCGPSVHIANHLDHVRIEAITLSPVQARAALAHVREQRADRQVRVSVADFHHLPYSDASFDVVMFLESSGYSYDQPALFAEVFRVLKPGGVLYVKDVFRHEESGLQQETAIQEFDRVYHFRTRTVSSTVRSVAEAGLDGVTSRDLSGQISIRRFLKAHYTSLFALSPFGERHRFQLRVGTLPIYFAEIKATKPGEGSLQQ